MDINSVKRSIVSETTFIKSTFHTLEHVQSYDIHNHYILSGISIIPLLMIANKEIKKGQNTQFQKHSESM